MARSQLSVGFLLLLIIKSTFAASSSTAAPTTTAPITTAPTTTAPATTAPTTTAPATTAPTTTAPATTAPTTAAPTTAAPTTAAPTTAAPTTAAPTTTEPATTAPTTAVPTTPASTPPASAATTAAPRPTCSKGQAFVQEENINACYYKPLPTRMADLAGSKARCKAFNSAADLCLPPPNLPPKKFIEALALKKNRVILPDKLPNPSEIHMNCVCYKETDKPCKFGKKDCNSTPANQCMLAGVTTCADISCIDRYCKDGTTPTAVFLRLNPQDMNGIKYWRGDPKKERMFFCCYPAS